MLIGFLNLRLEKGWKLLGLKIRWIYNLASEHGDIPHHRMFRPVDKQDWSGDLILYYCPSQNGSVVGQIWLEQCRHAYFHLPEDCIIILFMYSVEGDPPKKYFTFVEKFIFTSLKQIPLLRTSCIYVYLPYHIQNEPQSSWSSENTHCFGSPLRGEKDLLLRSVATCPASTCIWAPTFPSSWYKARSGAVNIKLVYGTTLNVTFWASEIMYSIFLEIMYSLYLEIMYYTNYT